ncbi:MAG: putative enzyme related to lactoylglutathione lyase [Phenylobacterium sp.]|jgi:predicted enzyme related to lactoylglutathione lyase
MDNHEKINYLEFPAKDIQLAKTFFGQVFGWAFEDYGPDYIALTNSVSSAGIDLGFYHAPLASSTANGSALVVFYSNTLEQTQAKIEDNGGTIVKAIFDFPGGRRFHFTDPNGNEFAVWSDVAASVTEQKT